MPSTLRHHDQSSQISQLIMSSLAQLMKAYGPDRVAPIYIYPCLSL